MSDQWEFYPCQMGDNSAFIFFDYGIRNTINGVPVDQQIRLDLAYKQPRENGLPTDAEFDAVSDVEDQIEAFAAAHAGIYVGRVTTAGHRYFYTYASADDRALDEFVRSIAESSGYQLEVRRKDDPEKQGYWSDLYPTELDWRTIWDLRVIDALQKAGDSGNLSRRIDHWAFFKNKKDALRFTEWAQSDGFELQSMRRTKPLIGEFVVQIHRSDKPELYSINSVTIALLQKAKELQGRYDGWETSVEKGQ